MKLSFVWYRFEIYPFPNPNSQGGIPVGSLLGPPDPDKTQIIQDPETGESKAKMTEVKVEYAQILWKYVSIFSPTKEQAVLAREIRRRGKNEVGFALRLLSVQWLDTFVNFQFQNAAQDCRKRANDRICKF